MCKINRYYAQINNDCAFPLVPALDAGTQKNRSYQSDIYTVSFHAIPRQAREQDSFDTPSKDRDKDVFTQLCHRLFCTVGINLGQR